MRKFSVFMFGLTALLCVSCLSMGGFGAPKQPTPEEITLIEAVMKDDAKAVNASLDKGLSPDTTAFAGETILMIAVKMNKPAMVDLLIKRGANVKKGDYDSGLTAIAYAPNKAMIDKVAAAGGDIKATGKNGQTALWMAIAQNNPAMIQAFIQKGVDVNATNRSGENALAVALSQYRGDGNLGVIKTLIDAKSEIKPEFFSFVTTPAVFNILATASSAYKNAPDLLHTYVARAASSQKAEDREVGLKLLQLLLDKKVDVNAVDSDGNTALFYAVAVSTSETAKTVIDPIDIVSLLLANKANAKAVNKSGKSVIFVLGANTYEVAQNISIYNYLFGVAGDVTEKASSAVGGALGGGVLGGFVSKTVKEEANKKFYEIAAKEITPKTYKALKAAGASF